jgi:SAM-dependent methyltransferase
LWDNLDMTLHQQGGGGQPEGKGAAVPSAELLSALSRRAGGLDRSVLEGVRRLSSLFTVGRRDLPDDYLAEPSLRRAYLQYFMPVTMGKIATLLQEMPPVPSRALRVLDVGSGPGAGSLAFLDYLLQQGDAAHKDLEVIAVDRSRTALGDAEWLWSEVIMSGPGRGSWALHPVRLDLERPGSRAPWKRQTFDLIIMANSLNELFRSAADPIARRAGLLEHLLSALAPDGTLIILEPALRDTTREFHQVRDRILVKGQATVYSPCLHDGPCPALVHPDDWCHEERPWAPPDIVRAIDREVGFIKDALKFSYLLLRKDGRTIAERGVGVYRVVSERMDMKGEQRAWLCNETGRQLVGRLMKARSDANRAFDDWHRGAIVRVGEIDRHGRVGRIGSMSGVEVVRPAYSKASREDCSRNGFPQEEHVTK